MTGVVTRVGLNHISPRDLQYLLYVLIDLRSEDEYVVGHTIGAINILQELRCGKSASFLLRSP